MGFNGHGSGELLPSPSFLCAEPDPQVQVTGSGRQGGDCPLKAIRPSASAGVLRWGARQAQRLVMLSWTLAFASASVQAQPAPPQVGVDSTIAGRVLASNCANCHGVDGRSAGGMPTLSGYQRDAMITTMQAFRSGQRSATIMHQLAKGYTDEQITLLAEHFSRQKALP